MESRNDKREVLGRVIRGRSHRHTPAHVRMSLLAALTSHHVLIRHPRTKWRLVDLAAGGAEAIRDSALRIPHALASRLLADGLIRELSSRRPRLYVLSRLGTQHAGKKDNLS